MNKPPGKVRLDTLLVERQLVESRQKAQALILAGKVKLNGQKSDKPGRLISSESEIQIDQPPQYVSRGGIKLAAAIEHFDVAVDGRICLDVGSSTGGFVDVLLQRGARRVHAADTGAGQIHWKIRTDPRVVLHERTNARYIKLEDIGERVDIVTCDVSFISVTLLLPALAPLLRANGRWITLVKPQFEVGREAVGAGGIVREPDLQQASCRKVAAAFENLGFVTAIMESPIRGMEGNREFLLHATRSL